MPLYNPIEVSGGGLSLKTAEIDFGDEATQGDIFTIVDTAITPTTKIIASPSGEAATGKAADENEFDSFDLTTVSGAGQFTLYANSSTGFVRGKFKIVYMS